MSCELHESFSYAFNLEDQIRPWYYLVAYQEVVSHITTGTFFRMEAPFKEKWGKNMINSLIKDTIYKVKGRMSQPVVLQELNSILKPLKKEVNWVSFIKNSP